MSTLYETRPGGTIVHLADGTGEVVPYGTAYVGKLAPENLKQEIAQGLSSHADATPRLSAEDANLALARDAHQRSALADNGQVNSGGMTVPSNYGELTEDAAALLVMNLSRYPEQQASIVMHEILYGGNRRKVIDGASEYAHLAAQSRIASLTDAQNPKDVGATAAKVSVTSPGDPDHKPGDAAASARYETAAAAALGLEALRGDAPDAKVPPASLAPQFAGKDLPDSEADKGRAEALQTRLDERDKQLEDLQDQLAALTARIEANSSTPTSGLTPGETGVPANRREATPDGGDATGFEGKGGVGTEGYWSNADLNKYAEQHEIADFPASGNRDAKLAALKSAGHDAPQTPKS
jgi:hypothetical protein